MKKLLIALFLLTTSQMTLAQDAKSIVEKLYNRNDGTTMVGKQTLTTCRYAINNKNKVCAENPRVKKFDMVRKDYGQSEKDKKTVSILVEPPGEKGISFLQYDYEEIAKDSDQWMYLSALKKVKRIVSAGSDEPKTGSFFGSEMSYEDMEQRQLDNYTYKLLKSEAYDERDCWVIESIPNEKRAKKSSYSKIISWIDKERNVILKSEMYDKNGDIFKLYTVLEVKNISGIWTETKRNMSNLQTKRMSDLTVDNVVYNITVNDNFLSQRTLTDMAFRESSLQNYLKALSN